MKYSGSLSSPLSTSTPDMPGPCEILQQSIDALHLALPYSSRYTKLFYLNLEALLVVPETCVWISRFPKDCGKYFHCKGGRLLLYALYLCSNLLFTPCVKNVPMGPYALVPLLKVRRQDIFPPLIHVLLKIFLLMALHFHWLFTENLFILYMIMLLYTFCCIMTLASCRSICQIMESFAIAIKYSGFFQYNPGYRYRARRKNYITPFHFFSLDHRSYILE